MRLAACSFVSIIDVGHMQSARTCTSRYLRCSLNARHSLYPYYLLLEKFVERGKTRGITEYQVAGEEPRKLDELVDRYTMKGYYTDGDRNFDQERMADEGIRDSALAGTLPLGTTLDTLRESGPVRFIDFGVTAMGSAQASPLEPNKTHVPFRNHTEDGDPFPTYARRAQFYIDHEWFMEAGETTPTHKPNPNMGGEYPLGITSGAQPLVDPHHESGQRRHPGHPSRRTQRDRQS